MFPSRVTHEYGVRVSVADNGCVRGVGGGMEGWERGGIVGDSCVFPLFSTESCVVLRVCLFS